MKRLIAVSAASLLIMLFWYSAVSAGDSFSFSVSCSIPAIPGVNVPMLEEEKIRPAAKDDRQAEENTPSQIEQDSKKEREADNGQKEMVLVKTIYAR